MTTSATHGSASDSLKAARSASLRFADGSSTGILPLVLGGNTFGWTSSEKDSRAVLDAFADAGGTLIDTADMYSSWAPGHSGGESEIILGRWLATSGRRDRVLVATKVSEHPQYKGLSAGTVAAAADESLLRLGTDRIDLYYAHFDDPSTPLEETAAAFDALVKAGKVRAIGLSNYSADRIAEWFRIARENDLSLPVALEPHYNLVHRHDFESALREVARREDLAVFPYFSLAAGFLTGKYRSARDAEGVDRAGMVSGFLTPEGFGVVDALDAVAGRHGVSPATAALAWLRSRPDVAAPIASARVPGQLPALLESATLTLDEEDVAALNRASQPYA
ncbi:aldo/keto reductase [uncultured Bifidobacterium sp.]|uniref:aldo/keto reductase n=1 Tax=uncultured Bifidobacterium sp. TaxID=165187 RepID=UPI0028DB1768|nr:aldo/keto reductase [uncultured Bifidobacterium sp.]